MLYVLFLNFFVCSLGFNYKNFIASSLISSTLINPIPITENPHFFKNQNELVSTKITTQRNNIYIYGEISPNSCEELKNQINEMEFNGKLFKASYNSDPPPINLHIQSSGGSLLNAFYIVDLIENSDIPINTYVDGYAASAASLISVVGKKKFMTENSMIMIHQLSSVKEGKYQELDDDMQNINMLMNKIKRVYLKHTNIPEPLLDSILNHDIWLDSETCKKYGLIDSIL
jgi:ATP-dependent protease ClpP protease subunit